MGVEIERKFLVEALPPLNSAPSRRLLQGYLCDGGDRDATIRVRIAADSAWLTVKGPSDASNVRAEYEYPIPAADAEAMLQSLCRGHPIAKTRYLIEHAGLTWELDVFEGANLGLTVAEIELQSPDQPVELPGWVGAEVTDDPRYYNVYLADHPFTEWNR